MDNEVLNTNSQKNMAVRPLTDQVNFQPSSLKPKTKNHWRITAIASTLSVLVVIALVAVVLNCRSPEAEVLYSINTTFLDTGDPGFLGSNYEDSTKYEIFESYSDYKDCYDTIDVWANDLIEKQTQEIEDSINEMIAYNSIQDPEDYKEDIMKNYTGALEERVEEIKDGLSRGDFNESFFDNNYLVLVEHVVYGEVLQGYDLTSAEVKGSVLDVVMNTKSGGVVAVSYDIIYFISVPKNSEQTLDTVNVNINSVNTSSPGVSYKPIIYLYPDNAINVSVKLPRYDLITTSYPKYSNGWDVFAKPDGSLIDNKTGKDLYSLYYESNNLVDFKIEDSGFIVPGEEAARFLEEKLSILGLNEREAEEFIIYWLPELEKNRYNYIRFASAEEINRNMPLEVMPRPDSIIRILMTFVALDRPIDIIPQKLSMPERTGFTVVEWGGTEIR